MEKPTKGETIQWSKKKLLKFSLFTIVVILLAAELLCRLFVFSHYRNLHTNNYIQGSPLQTADHSQVFINQPFYVDYHHKYQHNEWGMKSAPGDVFIPQKTPDDFWVLLTGASAMEGMGSNRNGEWLDITGIEDHAYNQNIAYYLQTMLQKSMPDKRVRVLNGATSAYTIYQSYQRYLLLSDKFQPDWVISMDGMNDPSELAPDQTTESYTREEWSGNPQFHAPLKYIIPLTRYSALINTIKQKLFHFKEDGRMVYNQKKDFPKRIQWLNTPAPPMKWAVKTRGIEKGIHCFSSWLIRYDSLLTARHQPHLLLLQPHMSMRDTANLQPIEMAVNHYYRVTFQDSVKHTYLKALYNQFAADSLHPHIVTMESVHHWPIWVFVDYCHFSDAATQKIAGEIFNYISSNGKSKIFKD